MRAELLASDVDPLLERLFALVGLPPPAFGSVRFDFAEGKLQSITPQSTIRVRREKAVASPDRTAHTERRG
jgi:hypothetical protein